MSQFNNFIVTLKNMGLSCGEAMDLISNNEYFYHIAHFKIFINNNQVGGTKTKIVKYNINIINEYIFYKTVNDDRIMYTLNSKNKDIHDCIIIYIDIVFRTAYIETIGNNKGCIVVGKIKNGGGRQLIKIALNLIKKIKSNYNALFIKKIKSNYNLEFIYLTDNTSKTLYDNKGNSHRVKLSYLTFFVQEKTYYEKYGFSPYKYIKNGKIKESWSEYNKFKKNVISFKLRDILSDTDELKKDYNNYKNIIKFLNDNKNMKISKIIKYLSQKNEHYEILCDIIDMFYNNLDNKLPRLWGMKL